MKILAIETSCDETAVAILECDGDQKSASFKILGNALLSQIDLHRKYGGVFPALAKREHAKNLAPLLQAALEEAELLEEDAQVFPPEKYAQWGDLLFREPGLTEQFIRLVEGIEPPAIDAIAVTAGPGLEPALWVGVNFASALALAWDKPLVPVNHLEGHIISALARTDDETFTIKQPEMPLLALGIAGGHTDLILMNEWLEYEVIGQTLDDSVGEAFDKVARMLGLPYPGGPQISKLAEIAREENLPNPYTFPRPMIRSGTYEFSFSGLKTSVLYLLKGIPAVDDAVRKQVAQEFENAVADVLWSKTAQAIEERNPKMLILSGGVSANKYIRKVFAEHIEKEYPHILLRIPSLELATDNAVMIGLAGYYRFLRGDRAVPGELRANGNLSLARATA